MSMTNAALLRASWESWISNDNRPRSGPWWLQWVWTLLFSAALALPFTLLGYISFGSGKWLTLQAWGYWYGKNLIVCTTICLVIHGLFDASRALFATPRRIGGWSPLQRTLFFSGVPMVGVVIGWPLGLVLAGTELTRWLASAKGLGNAAGSLAFALVITFVLHHWFSAKTRQLEAERRATEAQLRLLQAQIEPHFLFNTLANVSSLMDHDPPRAKQMLASFTDYLRASLGTLRAEHSTVANELELAQSYLQLLQARMEERLRFSIEADEATRAQPLPPLLLQPLVENAVVHGLEPSIEGGMVQVRAEVVDGALRLEVKDDGRGIDAPPRPGKRGAGVALANVRQRLATRYGSAATLELLPGQPGTLARITIPLDAPA
jgi:signal transduction histidine kinase